MNDQTNIQNPPTFDDSIFAQNAIIEHTNNLTAVKKVEPRNVFKSLLEQIGKVDFVSLCGVEDATKLANAHYRIKINEHIQHVAKNNSWGLCRNQDFFYVYNGCYWSPVDQSEIKTFLGEAAEKMGLHWEKARDYNFRKGLYEQFLETANFAKPEKKDSVLIPLQNGTFEINNGIRSLRDFNRNDFLNYQLPFEYNPEAKAPIFEKYLNEVLPDKERQLVLAEYLGYVFTKNKKLEKALILFGPGANGKSVFFSIIEALLGSKNVSNYSLSSLTDVNGYYRAMIANRLVNYSSEINGKLEASLFKQLVSNEPVECRLPYGQPMIIADYAKLIFNANALPHDIEYSHAFFRRFLIIAFDVTIPPEKQDIDLPRKIIQSELAGVFNWVLSGLDRLLANNGFTKCTSVEDTLKAYRKQADSVACYLDDEGYHKSVNDFIPLKEIYSGFRAYCMDSGYKVCSIRTLSERLRHLGFETKKKMNGVVVYLSRVYDDHDAKDGLKQILV